jgi:hypothetical protein
LGVCQDRSSVTLIARDDAEQAPSQDREVERCDDAGKGAA